MENFAEVAFYLRHRHVHQRRQLRQPERLCIVILNLFCRNGQPPVCGVRFFGGTQVA
jgi:hypothetical protein